MSLLNISILKEKYSLDILKIVHVGAHRGQEVQDYLINFGEIEINLFEPQVNIFEDLNSNYGNYRNIHLYNFALGSKKGHSKMYLAENDGQSSSLLKPKKHLNEHPEVHFIGESKDIEIKVLDDLNISKIDLINIDTQGYELEVLKGAQNALHQIKYILIEVNKDELYEGCPHVKDLDRLLGKYNFVRTETYFWADTFSWGDAFYIKADYISSRKRYFSNIKNYLYGIDSLYPILIKIRNFIWKVKKYL